MAAYRRPTTEAPGDAATDRELIDQTLAGEGAAFGILVERYQRKIFRIARSIVRDDADADQLTQDTFVQAYTSLRGFKGEASLETWLTRIAINKGRDHLRKRRVLSFFMMRSDDADDDEAMLEPVDERPDPERLLLSSQLRQAIARAEAMLSAQQQVIFRLRHHENLSLEEIAGHLGLQAGTVRAHLFRAVHKIRRELAAWRSNATLKGTTDEALQ